VGAADRGHIAWDGHFRMRHLFDGLVNITGRGIYAVAGGLRGVAKRAYVEATYCSWWLGDEFVCR